jgi:hypothetical protein
MNSPELEGVDVTFHEIMPEALEGPLLRAASAER